MEPLEVQGYGVCPEVQVDQAMMGNQDLLGVKEKVVALVLPAHLAPEVSLVSWVSLVLKEMMVHLAKTENGVALGVLAFQVLLERMGRLDLRVPQDLLAHLVTREMLDPLVHKDYKAYLVPVVLQEKMENQENQVQKVKLEHLEFLEARVILVPLENVDPLERQEPLALEVELDPLGLREERALLVPLVPLVLLVLLVCKGCQEREEVLGVLAQRAKRVNQAVRVLMEFQERMGQEVLLVLLVPLAQLVSLEIRVKVVPLDFQV